MNTLRLQPKLYITLFFISILTIINFNVLNIHQTPAIFGIFNLVFYLLVPGFLLLKMFKFKTNFGEGLGYSIVLSISFLIFLGLAINNILPLVHISNPLSTIPFLIGSNIALLTLFFIVLINYEFSEFSFDDREVNLYSILFSFVAFLFPVLTVFGANILNNGGPSTFTLIALLGISVYVLLLIVFRKRLNDFVFPFSIFFIALALLFMYSIRTPFLFGWDIQTEYKVFQLTKEYYQWTILNYHNAYNATLGITILPTIFSNLINIVDFQIFKVLYPIIFCFTSLGLYYLLNKYLSRTAAFLASFFFIIQMSYVSMPSLARQEIGYLAFVYLILTLFDNKNKKLNRNILFLIIGLTVVVSHYTTTYIMIGLFVSTYIISKTIQLIRALVKRFKPKLKFRELNFNLLGLNVLILLIATVFWYGIYTNAASNITNFAKSVYENISKIQTQEGRAGQSWITITGKPKTSTKSDFENYISAFSANGDGVLFYPQSVYEKYQVIPLVSEYISYNELFKNYPDTLGLIVRQIMKALIIAGVLYTCFNFFIKRKSIIGIEFLIFALLYLLLIVMAIFIPQVSAQYNMERLYQQGLIVLAFFPVFFIKFIYKKISVTYKYLFLCALFIVYFYSYHGVITQFFGGLPTINLNNYGNEYNEYYIHDTELVSADWLNKNRDLNSFIHVDMYAELRLASGTNISKLSKHLLPSGMWKNSYVYGTEENIKLGRVQATYNNTTLLYSFPTQFLQDNKDLIYSNMNSKIYK